MAAELGAERRPTRRDPRQRGRDGRSWSGRARGSETEGLIDARLLALMKPSAFLVNIARGAILDEDAVYAALRDRVIGGAALDVWWQYPSATEPERRPSRHPFHGLPNVIMTP